MNRSTLWTLMVWAGLTAPVTAQFDRASTDDRPEVLAAPPEGFDAPRASTAHGKLDTVAYDSASVGVKRRAIVYTPPEYTRDQRYPVLYLLHGIGGTEQEWTRGGRADVILDNLFADEKAVPMIVVMPNGRAAKDVTPHEPIPRQSPAFAAFERDLLEDLIPFIETTYAARTDRESRALSGLSMGGGQALNFGLANLETFAWIGGFSSAPNTRRVDELLADPANAAQQLKLLWVSCGDRDGLLRISEDFHDALTARLLPHEWRLHAGGGHDFRVWKADLYHFAQLLFR